MTSNVVNLRKARKAKERASKEKQAAENRVTFGRTKAERMQAEANEDLARRRHDALKLAPGNATRRRADSGGDDDPGAAS